MKSATVALSAFPVNLVSITDSKSRTRSLRLFVSFEQRLLDRDRQLVVRIVIVAISTLKKVGARFRAPSRNQTNSLLAPTLSVEFYGHTLS